MSPPVPKFTLPSGRQVPLMHIAAAGRPWEPVEAGHGLFTLVREKHGDSSRLERYRGANPEPLLFDAADAKALANELNRGPSSRSRRARE